jgi:hypothetical protein
VETEETADATQRLGEYLLNEYVQAIIKELLSVVFSIQFGSYEIVWKGVLIPPP